MQSPAVQSLMFYGGLVGASAVAAGVGYGSYHLTNKIPTNVDGWYLMTVGAGCLGLGMLPNAGKAAPLFALTGMSVGAGLIGGSSMSLYHSSEEYQQYLEKKRQSEKMS